MAILHEYVPSSKKEGYYIYAVHDGANVTYQVSALAQGILDKLSSCRVDEQLPDEVFYTLHRLGFIYTHQSGVQQPNKLDRALIAGESNSLSDPEREVFFDQLLSSNKLNLEEHKEIQEYLLKEDVEVKTRLELHSNWVPSPPDKSIFRGNIKRTLQEGDWGFIESNEVDVEDDIFFHVDELDGILLNKGMLVEFTYKQNDEGYRASHLRRLTDSYGRELEPEESVSESMNNAEGVGISGLSEGDRVEAFIDRRKGQKGLGKKGYLHIHHRRESSDGFLHISTKDQLIPVNEWAVVRVTEINDGYAEATMEAPSSPDPKNGDIPQYVP